MSICAFLIVCASGITYVQFISPTTDGGRCSRSTARTSPIAAVQPAVLRPSSPTLSAHSCSAPAPANQNARRNAVLRGHTDNVTDLAFSRNGKLLVSGSWDRTVSSLNPETGADLAVFKSGAGKVWS